MLETTEEQEKVLIASVLIIVGALVTVFLYTGLDGGSSEIIQAGTEDNNSLETTTDENSIIVERNNVEGEIIEVEIEGMTAEPVRPEISEEDAIEFINSENHAINIYLGEEYQSVDLESGESVIMDIRSITYYEVTSADEDETYRTLERAINVQ